ncbi:hypothetical protein NL676_034526 [Syzygium grande]|nr:hypothetical protein NL676_034526 [Syzygium grande]
MKDLKHYVDLCFRMRKRKRNDIAWHFCTVVDGNVGRVRCNFCGHVMWGGVTRLKHHLACIKGNVIPCRCCPPNVVAQIQEHLGQGSQKNEESMEGGSEQVNDVRSVGNVGQLPQDDGYWPKLIRMAEEFLNHVSPKKEENINGVSEQVNDMSGGGNKEQLRPEQDCWPELSDAIHEYVTQGLQNNEENMDGGSEQVNDMSCEGNEEQLQLKQECWRKSAGDDMFPYLFGRTGPPWSGS